MINDLLIVYLLYYNIVRYIYNIMVIMGVAFLIIFSYNIITLLSIVMY